MAAECGVLNACITPRHALEVPVTRRGLEVLTEEECRDLLRQHTVGRIAVRIGEAPAILPVNYAMLDDDVVFRTDPGSKLSAAIMEVVVAFEVDDVVEATRAGSSVLVRGDVEVVRDRATLDRVAALGLEPWVTAGRDYVVCIRTRTITGRRLPVRPPPCSGR
jgi:nitroimidazol reductase NimA-like FMN-containing flavoprotein (pyridoxamine 5'-phosphate oxidase superfamily)